MALKLEERKNIRLITGVIDPRTGAILPVKGAMPLQQVKTGQFSADGVDVLGDGNTVFDEEFKTDDWLYSASLNEVRQIKAVVGPDNMTLYYAFSADIDEDVAASEVLTLTANVANNDTVTIDTKTYTFQTTLTDVDGNVHIGATASDSLDNLIAAINLGSGAGTDYATSMTLHPTVLAAAGAGDTMDATAKIGGTDGNSIATTEVSTVASWTDTTMSGGVDNAENVFIVQTQRYKSVWVKNTHASAASVLQEIAFTFGEIMIKEFEKGCAPFTYDATSSQLTFHLSE